MGKLSKKVRLERALKEAEAHGRKWGLKNGDDWVFSIAVHWGFEEDIPAQRLISRAFLAVIEDSPEPIAPGAGVMDKEVEFLSLNIRRKQGDLSYPRIGKHPLSEAERRRLLKGDSKAEGVEKMGWKKLREKIWEGNPPPVGRIGRKQKGKRRKSL